MSTSFRGHYVRGIAELRQDDGVDAGIVSDALVNNVQHLYDAHHGHIVNEVTETGATPLQHPEPSAVEWRLVGRWPFWMIRAVDGGSATVVYRLGIYRDGGSGTIYVGARIGTARVEPFLGDTRTYQATHSTTSTTAEVVRGTLYLTPEAMASRHPGMVLGGPSGGAGFPARSAWVRDAYFELWCMFDGSKPAVAISSVMARQYYRHGPETIDTEAGDAIETEGGSSLLME